jgi:hypothetical protein
MNRQRPAITALTAIFSIWPCPASNHFLQQYDCWQIVPVIIATAVSVGGTIATCRSSLSEGIHLIIARKCDPGCCSVLFCGDFLEVRVCQRCNYVIQVYVDA